MDAKTLGAIAEKASEMLSDAPYRISYDEATGMFNAVIEIGDESLLGDCYRGADCEFVDAESASELLAEAAADAISGADHYAEGNVVIERTEAGALAFHGAE